jgi:hypothetical protein
LHPAVFSAASTRSIKALCDAQSGLWRLSRPAVDAPVDTIVSREHVERQLILAGHERPRRHEDEVGGRIGEVVFDARDGDGAGYGEAAELRGGELSDGVRGVGDGPARGSAAQGEGDGLVGLAQPTVAAAGYDDREVAVCVSSDDSAW